MKSFQESRGGSNPSPILPTANVPSAPACSLSAHRLPLAPSAHHPCSCGSAPPSPVVERPACVPPAVSACRRRSPATVPRPGAGGWLPRESFQELSAPRAPSLPPRAPQFSAECHPALARCACDVSCFCSSKLRSAKLRSTNQRPSFPSPRSPALSRPPLVSADWRAPPERSRKERVPPERALSAASPPERSVLAPSPLALSPDPPAQPEFAQRNSRNPPCPVAK